MMRSSVAARAYARPLIDFRRPAPAGRFVQPARRHDLPAQRTGLAGAHAGLLAGPIAPASDALVAAVLRWTILLVPVNWICGTTPFWCYGAALLLLFRCRGLSVIEALLLWLMAALTVGLTVGMARGAPLDRALASVYNLTILTVMLAFVNAGSRIGRDASERWRDRLYRAAVPVFAVNLLVIAAVFALTKATGEYDVAVRTLVLGLAGTLPGVFGEYGHVDLAITDWTVGGPETRVIGFGIYATEGALLFLLLGLLAAVACFAARQFWRVVAIETGVAVGLVLMASRTTLGAYLFSLLLLGAMQRRHLARAAVLALPLVVLAGLVIALYGGDTITTWLADRNQERLGSSDTRFLSYATAAAMVMAQNPLTGLGIKPVDLSLMQIPIGSHSTLSSMFTKGGVIGLGVVLILIATVVIGIVRSQIIAWRAPGRLDRARLFELIQLSRCALVILLWWTTEDLDAPAHEAALAGLCLGLFWSRLRSAARISRDGAVEGPFNHPE